MIAYNNSDKSNNKKEKKENKKEEKIQLCNAGEDYGMVTSSFRPKISHDINKNKIISNFNLEHRQIELEYKKVYINNENDCHANVSKIAIGISITVMIIFYVLLLFMFEIL